MKNLYTSGGEGSPPLEVQRTLPTASLVGAISLNDIEVHGCQPKTSSDGTLIPPEEQQAFVHFVCSAQNY